MTEKQHKIPKTVSKLFNWLLAILLSIGITVAWYQIGFYVYRNFDINQYPQPWGIPVVFIITLICLLALLKKFSIPFERITLPSKRVSLFLLIFSAVILLLFLTRYKVINTQGAGFYKIDRWTGTTYFIYGTTEKKVGRNRE